MSYLHFTDEQQKTGSSMNESDLSADELEFIKGMRSLQGKDYDTRAKFIQNMRVSMGQTPTTEEFIARLSNHLKTAN